MFAETDFRHCPDLLRHVPMTGLEPAPSAFVARCSSIELHGLEGIQRLPELVSGATMIPCIQKGRNQDRQPLFSGFFFTGGGGENASFLSCFRKAT